MIAALSSYQHNDCAQHNLFSLREGAGTSERDAAFLTSRAERSNVSDLDLAEMMICCISSITKQQYRISGCDIDTPGSIRRTLSCFQGGSRPAGNVGSYDSTSTDDLDSHLDDFNVMRAHGRVGIHTSCAASGYIKATWSAGAPCIIEVGFSCFQESHSHTLDAVARAAVVPAPVVQALFRDVSHMLATMKYILCAAVTDGTDLPLCLSSCRYDVRYMSDLFLLALSSTQRLWHAVQGTSYRYHLIFVSVCVTPWPLIISMFDIWFVPGLRLHFLL